MAIRSFIAISLPDSIKEAVASFLAPFRTGRSDVRWVSPPNLHLTLQFLGSTDESIIPDMRRDLIRHFCHYRPFYITIAGVGGFPSEQRPRVIWVGVGADEQLERLHRDIAGITRRFGFVSEERAFRPHLTVGRVRPPGRLGAAEAAFVSGRNIEFGTAEVSGIQIMRSDLTASGPIYTALADIRFGYEEE